MPRRDPHGQVLGHQAPYVPEGPGRAFGRGRPAFGESLGGGGGGAGGHSGGAQEGLGHSGT
eukprot:2512406-Pyramimonas_sp.AAC.1